MAFSTILPQEQASDFITEEERHFEELNSDSILCSLQLIRRVEMTYLTINYDNLPVYIELQHNPSLRSLPFILCDNSNPQSIIYLPSQEASNFNIFANMNLKEALEISPDLIILPPCFSFYSEILLQFFQIFSEYDSEFLSNGFTSATLNITEFMAKSKCNVQTISNEINAKINSIVTIPLVFTTASTKLLSNLRVFDSHDSNSLSLYEIESLKDEIRIEQIDGIPINKQHALLEFGIETVRDILIHRAIVSFLFPDKRFCWYLFSIVVNVDLFSSKPMKSCQKSIRISDIHTFEDLKHQLFILTDKISSKLKRYLSAIKFIKLILSKGSKKFSQQMEIPYFTMNCSDIFYFSYNLLVNILIDNKIDIKSTFYLRFDEMKINVSQKSMHSAITQKSLSSWLVQTDLLEVPKPENSSSISQGSKKKKNSPMTIHRFFEVSNEPDLNMDIPRSSSAPQSKNEKPTNQKFQNKQKSKGKNQKKEDKTKSKSVDLTSFFANSEFN